MKVLLISFPIYHPAYTLFIIRLIQKVVEAAHTFNKWVGICGELASDPLAVPLLIGLGVDELSVQPHSLLRVKKIISEINSLDSQKLSKKVLESDNPELIRQILLDFQQK